MTQLKGAVILVVDDEPALRGAIRFELEMEGALVSEARGGNEALELVSKTTFDLVLSDLRMADGDGVQLLDDIKKLNSMIPVVMFITGFSGLSMDQAYAKGCAGFVSKPFDPEELVRHVARALKTPPIQWRQKLEVTKIQTDVMIEYSSLEKAIDDKILNIAKGGMFVAKSKPLPQVGTAIRFALSWKDNRFSPLEGEGIVRWVRPAEEDGNPPGYGVEFYGLTDETIKQLSAYFKRLKNTVSYIPVS